MSKDTFRTASKLVSSGRELAFFHLKALEPRFPIARLPYCIKILLENLLRLEDGHHVRPEDIEALAAWDPKANSSHGIAFRPARVLMQDFTGVPAVVDFAAMRDAMAALGGDPARINPLVPADLVIDHSVIAEVAGSSEAFRRNASIEFDRNRERYAFLRWGQTAFKGLRIVPPDTGICHQVNLEYLATVVTNDNGTAYPDTLVGTDSHTTMINGLGVLGWGVGGIEAEAAMLGQPIPMLVPQVVGFRLSGQLPEGSTATDLVLTVTEMLRKHGVVGRFVEFFGPGVAALPLETRATIANMSPEYGSTCGIFPVDRETLRYLQLTGRPTELISLVEDYCKAQGLFAEESSPEPAYSDTLELQLESVVPSLAGPRRPQDRVALPEVPAVLAEAVQQLPPPPRPAAERFSGPQPPTDADRASAASFPASDPPASMAAGGDAGRPASPDDPHRSGSRRAARSEPVPVTTSAGSFELDHGHVVIAAITSCTNTSNPSVMLAAGLLARNAVEKGLQSKPWVKTSLAPGSRVVMDYYRRAGLLPYLEKLGFHLVGYGCTTCIGNSGPLDPAISAAINNGRLAVSSVLSGNRNFEGRIHGDCRLNWLASPPLVVAYALAGTVAIDLIRDPIGTGSDGKPVFLSDIWPDSRQVAEAARGAIDAGTFSTSYEHLFEGDESWKALKIPAGNRFAWDEHSTYVKKTPLFDGMSVEPVPVRDIKAARALAVLGDSVTTDHISPAGSIRADSPAGRYLSELGIRQQDFNSYGARRGNHEVMIRGTFANVRLRNRLVPGIEGGFTVHLPDGQPVPIYDAAMRYQEEGVPLIILAGSEYGTGSSRDWAAKGTRLLGVRAVIARSFERIHRSNLIGLGVLPLQFLAGESIESLGLSGREVFAIEGIGGRAEGLPKEVTVVADARRFRVTVRIDTDAEQQYFLHGGVLPYVLRQLLH